MDVAARGGSQRPAWNLGRRLRENLMVRAFLAWVLIALLLLGYGPDAVAAQLPALFTTDREAQEHCPQDVVVWLNLPTGIYHFKGQRWYGRTKSGAFVCEKEADQAGDRATRNGQ
jgi:hypothetical protein